MTTGVSSIVRWVVNAYRIHLAIGWLFGYFAASTVEVYLDVSSWWETMIIVAFAFTAGVVDAAVGRNP